MKKISYEDIIKNQEINAYITMGNECLAVMGYTDHSQVHGTKVAAVAARILKELGYSKKE